MYTSMWFMSVVAILVVDVRTGALLQKDEPRRCHQCAYNGSAACAPARVAPCPARDHHCATVAVAPDFTSTLTCAAAAENPCSLSYSSKHALQLTCTCPGWACNAPFTPQLRNHLLNFTSTNNTVNLTKTFFKPFINITKDKLYYTITVKVNASQPNNTQLPIHVIEHMNDIVAPRAEALKQEATEPSDDEEDEGEGSGTYDEARLRRPASAPAAPSSYLPANENTAPPLLVDFLLMTAILFVPL
ncbi:hypothetical protein MSG28_011900 [Choristoneura fumiferana]|uniref:Uncharacterized protein n=1 Tax=Choristoneura fumiferana TaxID=7141 RepID=A0ACC0KMS2_CHOFU|nr:hypothetical protein MSG28_011900 [Choristoneura fumiferana]